MSKRSKATIPKSKLRARRKKTPSVESFIAAAEEAPAASDADDMGDYLGEVFVEHGRAVGNDIALDMETLQPLHAATVLGPPPVAMGPAVSEGQVRDLEAEFEDAPTLPQVPLYRGPEVPDVHVAARFAAFDDAQRPRVRVNGR